MAAIENPSMGDGERRNGQLPEACDSLVRQLFADSLADHWHLSLLSFQAALARGASKRFREKSVSAQQISAYLAGLHIKDLALACACADGSESAWNHFISEYRGHLRAAAGAVLHQPSSDPAAIELADSLFADLYGLTGGKGGGRSLFRYFHGRSSLKTWLRAVLAQRHIDAIRAGCGAKMTTIFRNEMIPRAFRTVRTGAGQCQILDMKTGEVGRYLLRSEEHTSEL